MIIIIKKFIFNKDEFIKNYNELQSSRKMAELYKCNKTTILNYAKEIGYNNHYDNKLTSEEIQEIINQYEFKDSIQLADEYNVSRSYITKIWHDNNLKGKRRVIYPLNQNYFNKNDSKDKAYFLGLLSADGNVYLRNNGQATIRISLQYEDRYILKTFKKYIETDKPLQIIEKKNTDYITYIHTLELVSNIMANDLSKYNVIPNKTKCFVVPDLSNEFYSSFIRGYFDGDGGVSIKNNEYNKPSSYSFYIAGYYKNLSKIQEILHKNNIESVFSIDKRKEIKDDVFGSLNISSIENKYKFIQYIYKDCDDLYMSRKKYKCDCFINAVNKNYCNKQKIYNKIKDNKNMINTNENKIRGFEVVNDLMRKTTGDVTLPTRGTSKSMAYDFYANDTYTVMPNEIVKIWTDVKAYMQDNECLVINVRSSMGGKFMLANTQGWIDADYYSNENNDGNIGVFLKNISDKEIIINKGERIAQGVFLNFLVADNGNINKTRVGGFGSTGTN